MYVLFSEYSNVLSVIILTLNAKSKKNRGFSLIIKFDHRHETFTIKLGPDKRIRDSQPT
jgi:hypothetical protein